jgi:hypothetical protein
MEANIYATKDTILEAKVEATEDVTIEPRLGLY